MSPSSMAAFRMPRNTQMMSRTVFRENLNTDSSFAILRVCESSVTNFLTCSRVISAQPFLSEVRCEVHSQKLLIAPRGRTLACDFRVWLEPELGIRVERLQLLVVGFQEPENPGTSQYQPSLDFPAQLLSALLARADRPHDATSVVGHKDIPVLSAFASVHGH